MTGTTATSQICGFDIGTENCYIGIARQGGLEIVLNDYSQRSTPGYVCITDKQRELGVSAKQKQNMYISTTFYNLRRMIGRPYEEVVQQETLPFPTEKAENGEAAVQVTLNNEDLTLTSTQLLAMVFTKLRQLSNQPTDCVINCPGYFTDSQRRALHDAATIAGLSPLRIMPDLSAVALYYCFYRLNPKDEKNHLLAFLDVGASSTQCSIVYYEAKKCQVTVLGSEYDSNLGGRDFDQLIADHFIKQKGLTLNKRARIRLLAECEKLKKQMSANSNELPINIECLYEERDFSARMGRSEFEQLCAGHFDRIKAVLERALVAAQNTYAKIQADSKEHLPDFQIETVEVVGGSSRIPAVKRLIKDVFSVEASATMNADEAVALGCTLQSALLSPNFKVARQLQVVDYQPYQINARYWHEQIQNSKVLTVAPLFAKGDAVPFTRQITLTCHSLPIAVEFDYLNEHGNQVRIGKFRIQSAEPLEFATSKMKLRVRVGNSGLLCLTSAILQVEEQVAVDEQMSDIAQSGDSPQEQQAAEAENKNNDQSKPKTRIRNVELRIEPVEVFGRLDEKTLDNYRNLENNLVLADKNWRERSDARNELEEFVYEWRDRIESEEIGQYIEDSERQLFASDLRHTEDWLRDDEDSGELQPRQVYLERLNNLKQCHTENLLFRRREHETRGPALEKLGRCLQMGDKILVEADQRLDAKVLDSLKQSLTNTQEWFDKTHQTFVNFRLCQQPPVKVAEIGQQIEQLEKAIKPVLEQQQKLRKQDEEEKAKQQQQAEKDKNNAESAESAADASAAQQNPEQTNGSMEVD